MNRPAPSIAKLLTVRGRVQGVGFRPFVSRLAHELGLSGWVRNVAGEVEIFVQGGIEQLASFERALIEKAPPLARPQPASVRPARCADLDGFAIAGSETGAPRHAHIPADYFLCDACREEMNDPGQRRYRYPFINCTQCGPRYTLIRRLPYDRPNTAMAGFPLCDACRREYDDPLDRRFHAQPLACPACGPSLQFRREKAADDLTREAALAACVAALRAGAIVAVKGVGGYHLLCDGTCTSAVTRLRRRKQRPDKPLAVMIPWRGGDGLDFARTLADADSAELSLLKDPLRPIVLMTKRSGSPLAESIAPGVAEVGLMLPYSPLHHLLLNDFAGPLVATSANLGGEPVLTEAADVENRLGAMADAFLHHDRPILRPADDAVFRVIAGLPRPLRLGRGCAPLEIELPFHLRRPILAVGGQLKNALALGWDQRAAISPHIGDPGTPRGRDVFKRTAADLASLYGLEIAAVACDAHPNYTTGRYARDLGLPHRPIFHHHAHASALAGEHGLPGPMLVFAWDGAGFGEDSSIWGGEALLGEPGQWRRVASFRRFHLPGGERAAREPWRSGLALCWEAGIDWPGCPQNSELLQQAWQRRLNCPPSSAVGRLFDAAAALIGIAIHCSYEGHAPMWLEARSDHRTAPLPLPLRRESDGLWRTDWSPLLPMLLDAKRAPAERAGCFHASLALALLRQAETLREASGVNRIGLTGGVFQNRLLTESALILLQQSGFEILLHQRIPANDAGLAFGQLIEAGASGWLTGTER